MKLHMIMHESFESPAAIEQWSRSRKHEVQYTRLYNGDMLPKNVNDFDFLIVMGGPQSPATTKSECSYFDGPTEIEFIKKAIENEKLVLGVCLGAQLIGEALGAKFDHSPNREIGVYELELTDDAKKDPIFSKFPKKFLVSHWHGDMPGLTKDSKILAKSKGCPRQIIKYTERVYGFQCHFEFTPESVEGMIKNCSSELAQYKHLPYVQQKEQLRKHNYDEMNKLLFKFLDCIASSYG